jgi:type I restriction enzyme S subunit
MKHGNVRISDLIHPVRNWNPSTSVAADFVYVDISSVDAKQKRIAEPKNIPCSSAPSRARQLLESTDVLVSTVRPNLNCVAYVPGELEGAIASTGFCVLRPNKQALDSRYLFHWVQSEAFIGDMVSKATGASYPAVSDSIIHASEIPLPPLEEQRRIAAILDKAQDMSRKSQLSCALASSLIESEMIRGFGRPGDSQAHSRLLSLVEAGVSVIDCPHSTPKWTDEGRVCLRTSNLGKGDWIWHDTRRISDNDFQERSRRAPLEHGDIVLSREGTVGIAAIVTSDMDVCMGQRLVQLKLDARHLTPEYLLAQLLYLLKPERISHAMTGSTSKHINVKDLRELKISCPPIEEQSAFDNFCKQTKKMRARIALLEKNSEILSRSIQAASFCS